MERYTACVNHFLGKSKTCINCMPDYIAKEREDYIPNSQCSGYKPMTLFTVEIKGKEIPAEYRKEAVA